MVSSTASGLSRVTLMPSLCSRSAGSALSSRSRYMADVRSVAQDEGFHGESGAEGHQDTGASGAGGVGVEQAVQDEQRGGRGTVAVLGEHLGRGAVLLRAQPERLY